MVLATSEYGRKNVQHMVESVNTDNLHRIVAFLTAINPPRTYDHPGSLNAVASFIEKEFSDYGYRPQEQIYTFRGETYRNILASVGPEDAPRMIIGAHYDVCDEQPGADDNASAVAGLLELARLLTGESMPLRHRIDFAAYTLEEPPASFTECMGSYVHARFLRETGVKVLGMISLEMIGYFSDEPKSQSYPAGMPVATMPDVGNFIAVVGRPIDAGLVQEIAQGLREASLPTEPLLALPEIPGVSFSDHWGFWKLGFTAAMITDTAFYRNPHYHQTSDTIDTLDFPRMGQVVQGLYLWLMERHTR